MMKNKIKKGGSKMKKLVLLGAVVLAVSLVGAISANADEDDTKAPTTKEIKNMPILPLSGFYKEQINPLLESSERLEGTYYRDNDTVEVFSDGKGIPVGFGMEANGVRLVYKPGADQELITYYFHPTKYSISRLGAGPSSIADGWTISGREMTLDEFDTLSEALADTLQNDPDNVELQSLASSFPEEAPYELHMSAIISALREHLNSEKNVKSQLFEEIRRLLNEYKK